MKAICVLALGLLWLGCAPRVHFDVTPLGGRKYESRPSGSEVLIFTEIPKDRKCVELALLAVSTDMDSFTKKDFGSLLPKVKNKVCELGGDAVVVKSVDLGGIDVGDKYASKTPTRALCLVIKFVD